MTFADFFVSDGFSKPPPHDAYDHAFNFVDRTGKVIRFDESYFNNLVDGVAAYTGNIPRQKIEFYRNDVRRLAVLFEMALKEPVLRQLYLVYSVGWHGEINMTRNTEGGERIIQGAAGRLANIGDIDAFKRDQMMRQLEFEQATKGEEEQGNSIMNSIKQWRQNKKAQSQQEQFQNQNR